MKKLMYFTAAWCGPCRALAPVMAELGKEINVEKIDVDTQQDIATSYGITSVPTIIMTVDGVEKERKVGAAAPKVFLTMYNKY